MGHAIEWGSAIEWAYTVELLRTVTSKCFQCSNVHHSLAILDLKYCLILILFLIRTFWLGRLHSEFTWLPTTVTRFQRCRVQIESTRIQQARNLGRLMGNDWQVEILSLFGWGSRRTYRLVNLVRMRRLSRRSSPSTWTDTSLRGLWSVLLGYFSFPWSPNPQVRLETLLWST